MKPSEPHRERVKPTVWAIQGTGISATLLAALRIRGVEVHVVEPDAVLSAAVGLYGGRGAVLVDARGPTGRALVASAAAHLVRVIAIARAEHALPDGVLPLRPGAVDAQVHHILDVLHATTNLRRHPRVPAALPVEIEAERAQTVDISLYGLWVAPSGAWSATSGPVELKVVLSDGARVRLTGHVVDRRGDGIALRCEPVDDEDLLLWVHLLIGALEQSPLYRDVDPFGPLFEME